MLQKNYKEDLAKYVKNADQDKLAAVIRACGIALRGLDAQYVSFVDPAEVMRVANGFAAKKLGLSQSTAKAALAKVATIMKADRTKLRTTVYYLLAKETGTLGKLASPAKKAVKKAAKKVKKAAKKVKKAAKKKAKKAKRK